MGQGRHRKEARSGHEVLRKGRFGGVAGPEAGQGTKGNSKELEKSLQDNARCVPRFPAYPHRDIKRTRFGVRLRLRAFRARCQTRRRREYREVSRGLETRTWRLEGALR